ncbi:M56 family metallopeptidase [Rhodococcus sp. UFZ-B548]|uniref:M56 family metallopeptidase n=1 Tax=Rhodococcus sp. UFZ-B548 TaxID=2742212 RepID=UPI0015F6E4C3|nr:M56 family metallopeptidase [Rhodococcus sp. UFZ-B548]
MTLALPMLLGAVFVGFLVPRALRAVSSTLSPTVLLAAWLGSMASALYLALSAVLVLVWPSHAPVDGIARCFSAFAHGTSSWVGELITGTAVGVVGLIAVRIVLAGRKQAREHARVRDFHRDVLSIVARRDNSESDVLWLDHPLPMAYSVAGKPGFVVATQGLSSALTGGERDAVLAHERAHLSGGHHRIVGACEVLAAVLPGVPLFAAAPAAVGAIVELSADRHAARVTSPAAVRSALAVVSKSPLPQPDWSLGDRGGATAVRLRSLVDGDVASPRRLTCAVAACVPAAVTTAVAAAVTVAVSAGICAVLT